jgi:hypothetical protein
LKGFNPVLDIDVSKAKEKPHEDLFKKIDTEISAT